MKKWMDRSTLACSRHSNASKGNVNWQADYVDTFTVSRSIKNQGDVNVKGRYPYCMFAPRCCDVSLSYMRTKKSQIRTIQVEISESLREKIEGAYRWRAINTEPVKHL